jgi:cytochrome c556
MTSFKSAFRTLVGVGAVLAAGAAMAMTGAEIQKDREVHMKEMGKASKAIADQLKTGSADAAVIKPAADKIAENAKALPTWFPKGTGTEVNAKSRALPAIWTEPQLFQAKAHDLVVASANLDAVSGSGDMAKVVPAMKAVGASCHACHEKFQAPDKD